MRITVEISDKTAANMLGDVDAAGKSLLELAGYTACVSGRISEFEYGELMGVESRFAVHDVMKRLQMEQEASDAEYLRQEAVTLAALSSAEGISASR